MIRKNAEAPLRASGKVIDTYNLVSKHISIVVGGVVW
jgi:hypothetical protein